MSFGTNYQLFLDHECMPLVFLPYESDPLIIIR